MRANWWKICLAAGLVAAAATAVLAAVEVLRDDGPPSPPPSLLVGAVEDAAKFGDPDAKMALARDAGFGAIVLSARWTPPLTAPPAAELDALRAAAAAAAAGGITPIVAVYQLSSATPLTDEAQGQFASYTAAIATGVPSVRHLIVGNEPNLNLFWQPQFLPDGTSVAPQAFLSLLARTYDAVKAADPAITVIGAGLAPRGTDRPAGRRPTHSPTTFLRALGEAYRESGRDRPVMDMLSIHPYGEDSSVPPELEHPRTTTIGLADYGKLVALLGEAFDGTAQAGSQLPIVYGEYGIETTVTGHEAAYTGVEPPSIRPVDAEEQGDRYARAIRLAACQPTVRMLLLFHVSDERELERLQTGVHWADDTPKPSVPVVRDAIAGLAGVEC